jgi:hypothetical protein
MPIIPVLRRHRQNNCEFEASLGYIDHVSKKNPKQKLSLKMGS